MRRLAILGATGSIGTSTLDVVARHPDRFTIEALTANRSDQAMADLCERFSPRIVVMADTEAASRLQARLTASGSQTEVQTGEAALAAVASLETVDTVVAAIVGAAGLLPTLAAAHAGKRILLANKEALVLSGQLFLDACKEGGAELLPLDSEHNAIFQCLPDRFERGLHGAGIRDLVLTASGGPFRTATQQQLETVTPDQACAHPNWEMGRKISVDSATMMNKGLEVIEASWLFGIPVDRIRVVIHPQSLIHSMVEYEDGSSLAQMGRPDMRTAIAHGLAWPDRIESGVEALDLIEAGRLEFEAPSDRRFPCLPLAFAAARAGGGAAAILNAANEVAVEAFLRDSLAFTGIAEVIAETLERCPDGRVDSIDAVMELDRQARVVAADVAGRRKLIR